MFYNLRVKINQLLRKNKRETKNKFLSKKVKDNVFYYSLITVPVILLVFTYLVINGNSILLAFRQYDPITGSHSWAGFTNFKDVFLHLKQSNLMQTAFRNSVKSYFIILVVTTIVPVLLSYYIYKKLPLHGFFKVVLFMPSIISGIVTVTIYKYIADLIIPTIAAQLFDVQINGLLSNPNKTFGTVLFYYLWMSMGGGLLIQLGAMNSVDKSVTEAGELDGVGFFREFWHIVLPKVYQIISIGFILGIVSIFTNDLGLYAFYGTSAEGRIYTLGYYFTVRTLKKDILDYPFLAAWGLIATVIAVPVTFLARHFIYTMGPQED